MVPYKRMKCVEILHELDSEEKAQHWIWQAKFDGKEFVCPKCCGESYYQHKKNNGEMRECKNCHFRVRLRANTIFQNSKLPMLTWLKAICLMAQGKRGISALELQSELKMSSYGTAWRMLHKIREAVRQRDDIYKLSNTIELDGAVFGKRHTNNQSQILVAVESKDWIDARGHKKRKAGFAKVIAVKETKKEAQQFVDRAIEKGSMVNTDGSPSLMNLENVDVDYQVTDMNKETIDHWLPWVHKFISNAKSWLLGTHHGVAAKYLGAYLSEYTFRFNRRHDPDSLFFRILGACVRAAPKKSRTLLR